MLSSSAPPRFREAQVTCRATPLQGDPTPGRSAPWAPSRPCSLERQGTCCSGHLSQGEVWEGPEPLPVPFSPLRVMIWGLTHLPRDRTLEVPSGVRTWAVSIPWDEGYALDGQPWRLSREGLVRSRNEVEAAWGGERGGPCYSRPLAQGGQRPSTITGWLLANWWVGLCVRPPGLQPGEGAQPRVETAICTPQ